MAAPSRAGYRLAANPLLRTHAELEVFEQCGVHDFLPEQRPDCIFIAAAKVGGIQVNDE